MSAVTCRTGEVLNSRNGWEADVAAGHLSATIIRGMTQTPKAHEVMPSERAVAVAAVETLLRLLRHTKDCFPRDDLETVAIYLTVAAASAGHSLRDYPLLVELAGGPLPDDLQKPTSGRAIAAATALPRETVRRKLSKLVAEGRLIRVDGSVRIPTDTLNRDRNREFAGRIVHELITASGRLERFSKLDQPTAPGEPTA
jgi:hypothetical protein